MNCPSPVVCYARPWLVTKVWAKALFCSRWPKLSAVSFENQVQKKQKIGNLSQGSPSALHTARTIIRASQLAKVSYIKLNANWGSRKEPLTSEKERVRGSRFGNVTGREGFDQDKGCDGLGTPA